MSSLDALAGLLRGRLPHRPSMATARALVDREAMLLSDRERDELAVLLTSSADDLTCPRCGNGGRLQEQQLVWGAQGCAGLRLDGSADAWDSTDSSEDAAVVGYSCGECGWYDAAEISDVECDRLAAHAQGVRDQMVRRNADGLTESEEVAHWAARGVITVGS